MPILPITNRLPSSGYLSKSQIQDMIDGSIKKEEECFEYSYFSNQLIQKNAIITLGGQINNNYKSLTEVVIRFDPEENDIILVHNKDFTISTDGRIVQLALQTEINLLYSKSFLLVKYVAL